MGFTLALYCLLIKLLNRAGEVTPAARTGRRNTPAAGAVSCQLPLNLVQDSRTRGTDPPAARTAGHPPASRTTTRWVST